MWEDWVASSTETDIYGWQMYSMFDHAARAILEPVGARFLDVVPMSDQRPDAHTAYRYRSGRRRAAPDCLHPSLPGIPDTWNAMLLGASRTRALDPTASPTLMESRAESLSALPPGAVERCVRPARPEAKVPPTTKPLATGPLAYKPRHDEGEPGALDE